MHLAVPEWASAYDIRALFQHAETEGDSTIKQPVLMPGVAAHCVFMILLRSTWVGALCGYCKVGGLFRAPFLAKHRKLTDSDRGNLTTSGGCSELYVLSTSDQNRLSESELLTGHEVQLFRQSRVYEISRPDQMFNYSKCLLLLLIIWELVLILGRPSRLQHVSSNQNNSTWTFTSFIQLLHLATLSHSNVESKRFNLTAQHPSKQTAIIRSVLQSRLIIQDSSIITCLWETSSHRKHASANHMFASCQVYEVPDIHKDSGWGMPCGSRSSTSGSGLGATGVFWRVFLRTCSISTAVRVSWSRRALASLSKSAFLFVCII